MVYGVNSGGVNTVRPAERTEEREGVRRGGERTESKEERGHGHDRVSLNAPEEKDVTYARAVQKAKLAESRLLVMAELVERGLGIQQALTSVGKGDEKNGDGGGAILDASFIALRADLAQKLKEWGLGETIDIGVGIRLRFDELTPEAAQKLVADDGYWGVEQTSSRIVEFALGLAGKDPALLDKIREGITKGFDMAKRDFGGELPEISQKTIDTVMKKLDDWAEEMKGAAA